jgi:hypothetical protein
MQCSSTPVYTKGLRINLNWRKQRYRDVIHPHPSLPLEGEGANAYFFPTAKVQDMTRENFNLETHPADGGQMQGPIFRDPEVMEAVQA